MVDKKKSPHPVDIHVGSRVRLRRMMTGMSQDKLGEALGLTFQQVQKYEKGVNRIGASRLFEISKILTVPIQFFYDDAEMDSHVGFAEENLAIPDQAPGTTDQSREFMELLSSPEGVQLCKAFSGIKDIAVRRRVLDLVKTLADEG